MDIKIKIGNRIKFLREDIGYTQKELATKLGLKGETAIANYESGYSIPKDDVKFKMCDLFNCSLDYLLCKTDIRNTGKQIDDVLNEAMIGMSAEEYENLTETQKKQIRDFALYIKNQEKGENK